ncbi:hypothetical protein ACIBCT_20810 [Streptosporangium sp. NPDC050855]|uniref:hypothetical protein n=1 Tax=Streptosporangium sp. NPDC050855 TaxID=3366194 RepID=UPI0037BD3441
MSTETPEQIRADERARCVAELRTYSEELMSASVSQVSAGKDEGFGGVRFAASMGRAAQLLESGKLTPPAALSVSSGEAESR